MLYVILVLGMIALVAPRFAVVIISAIFFGGAFAAIGSIFDASGLVFLGFTLPFVVWIYSRHKKAVAAALEADENFSRAEEIEHTNARRLALLYRDGRQWGYSACGNPHYAGFRDRDIFLDAALLHMDMRNAVRAASNMAIGRKDSELTDDPHSARFLAGVRHGLRAARKAQLRVSRSSRQSA
jgi:cbb3-type cytochrome oxidase subunit 3